LRGSIYSKFLEKVGHEDYALWLSILKDLEGLKRLDARSGVIGIDEPLAIYRLHATSFSASKLKAALYQWIIYRKYERLGVLESVLLFLSYARKGLIRRFYLRTG
jgi:teichuronic acid biosynthesis glycosyltransferase TuaG